MGKSLGKMLFFKSGSEKLEPVNKGFFDFTMTDIKGNPVNFESFRGKYKAYIIVNVASACGLANANYTQLAKFHDQYESLGLKILGFPCNQFNGQENKCELDIEEFVRTKFNIKFDMFSKIEVNGPNCHPLYKFLRRNSELYDPKTDTCKEIEWNFVKFIVNQNGKVVAFKAATDKPDSFRPMIEQLLKEPLQKTK